MLENRTVLAGVANTGERNFTRNANSRLQPKVFVSIAEKPRTLERARKDPDKKRLAKTRVVPIPQNVSTAKEKPIFRIFVPIF